MWYIQRVNDLRWFDKDQNLMVTTYGQEEPGIPRSSVGWSLSVSFFVITDLTLDPHNVLTTHTSLLTGTLDDDPFPPPVQPPYISFRRTISLYYLSGWSFHQTLKCYNWQYHVLVTYTGTHVHTQDKTRG